MSDAMTAQADPLHYGSQQTTMLGHLVRLPPTPPIESITKLVSQEPLLLAFRDSLYAHRRAPPSRLLWYINALIPLVLMLLGD